MGGMDERDPGTSIPSETRNFVRQERLRSMADGGGPSGLLVVLVALIVIGIIVYAVTR